MRQSNITHKRITAIVRQEVQTIIRRARDYKAEQREHPDSELATALKKRIISGIEFENTGAIRKEFITINDEFLSLVGYDGDFEGFLADYFGKDFKHSDGEPLRCRFIDGFLMPQTKKEGR